MKHGTERVFSEPDLVVDDKFFDNSLSWPNNLWYRYSNGELRKNITDGRFMKFPIATDIDEPRLLIVSTDIGDGATITFDSYSQESEYGRIDKRSGKYLKRSIKYDKGIEPAHVMASACIPLFYNAEEIQGRKFWDGGVLSNTPLREVLHMHRDYWHYTIGKRKDESKVPDLEIYINSIWPSSSNSVIVEDGQNKDQIPSDYDGLKSKLYDIGLSDKTEYDEKTAIMVSDLVEIIKKIRELAPGYMTQEKKIAFSKELQNFLDNHAQSKGRGGDDRTFSSLLNGRFKIQGDIVRIELRDDHDGISNRAFDLSTTTIRNLIAQGEKDAREILIKRTP